MLKGGSKLQSKQWNNDDVTFDKCRDELQDITVNWGHSPLFVSRHPLPTFNSAFLQHFRTPLHPGSTFMST